MPLFLLLPFLECSPVCWADLLFYHQGPLPHMHSSLWFSQISWQVALPFSLCPKTVLLLDVSRGIVVPGYPSVFLVTLMTLLGSQDTVLSLCEHPAAGTGPGRQQA